MNDDTSQNSTSAQDPVTDPTPASTTPDPLTLANQQIAELTEVAKRAMADLQNFKRRTEEERAGLIVFANRSLLEALFPAIDNFGRAFQHMPEELKENEWVKGVYAIEKQLIDTLKTLGLEEIACLPGAPFNPHEHEVVMQATGEKNAILECFEKGYRFKGQVVRPAKVKVGDGNSPS